MTELKVEDVLNSFCCGDCVDAMRDLPDNCVDAIVTDPPYELGFMGKSWDKSGIAYTVEVWRECLRVLKPGGHLLAFGGSRTYHRMACAIEDAGFEIRDMIEWVYGNGFPKSQNISKMIDKQIGVERTEVLGMNPYNARRPNGNKWADAGINGKNEPLILAPATDAAKQWEGWGTALKPAHEPIVLARKPLAEKTVAENVLKYGTGGINIDGCRIGVEGGTCRSGKSEFKHEGIKGQVHATRGYSTGHDIEELNKGRFPANFIHDGSAEVLANFPITTSGTGAKKRKTSAGFQGNAYGKESREEGTAMIEYGDTGSAARFFYCAKASKSERNAGCTDMVNNHPTVKALQLMKHLVTMVTPPGGIVLDPFCGSGSTCVAAVLTGKNFIGIDMNEEYLKIAGARVRYWREHGDVDD